MSQYNKNDPQSIQRMFGSIAKQYDRTNAILSFQMHKLWNKQLVSTTLSSKPQSYLDLCCGTGEISLNYLKRCSHACEAYLLDFCPEMLFFAKEREKSMEINKHHKITYLQADAQLIPLTHASIDCATIAYGIRNVPNPSKCFDEVYRVLRAGGKIGILELTQPKNPLLNLGHSLYLRTLLPLLGKLVTSNHAAYQYLCNSIKNFSQPEELEKTLQSAGFKNTKVIPLTGGIATIILAEK